MYERMSSPTTTMRQLYRTEVRGDAKAERMKGRKEERKKERTKEKSKLAPSYERAAAAAAAQQGLASVSTRSGRSRAWGRQRKVRPG
jgi:hypothetical protein